MKSIYIYAFALLSVLFAACSDDNSNMNNATVKVSFEQSAITFNENAGIVKVPFSIEGEPNGDIKIAVKATDGSAIAQGHYILTDNTIIIPAGSDNTTWGCELRLLDDGDAENDDRTFTITIEGAEGATIGTNATCTVTLADVDKDPYFKLQGDWTLNAINATNGEAVSFDVNISNGGNAEYNGKSFVFKGFQDRAGYSAEAAWTVEYNASSKKLKVVRGAPYAAYNFTGLGPSDVRIIPMDENANESDGLTGTWNETFDTIVFDPDNLLGSGVFPRSTGSYAGFFSVFAEVTLTKK